VRSRKGHKHPPPTMPIAFDRPEQAPLASRMAFDQGQHEGRLRRICSRQGGGRTGGLRREVDYRNAQNNAVRKPESLPIG
jgi:hypothetical protein